MALDAANSNACHAEKHKAMASCSSSAFTSLSGPVAWSEGSRTRLDDAGNRIFRPATRLRAARYGVPGRVRYRAPCAYLTPSPRSRCGCRLGVHRVARMVREHSLQAAGPPRASAHSRAGRRGVAVDRAQPDGDEFEKQRRRPPPRTTKPGRPRHGTTDDAAALFFRAVARDRHPTPACPASCTRRGHEKRCSDVRI